jgi:predicted Fe-Mo cluster-binding NifX family protein
MKIAAVTDDGKTISQHFGRATKYLVVTVENGQEVERELRDKLGHRDFQKEGDHGHHQHHEDERGRGFGNHSAEKHRRMFEAISDCKVLLSRGMGRGAYIGLEQAGIRPVLTDIPEIDAAVSAVIDGSIQDLTERLH